MRIAPNPVLQDRISSAISRMMAAKDAIGRALDGMTQQSLQYSINQLTRAIGYCSNARLDADVADLLRTHIAPPKDGERGDG